VTTGDIQARLELLVGPEPDAPSRALITRLLLSYLAKTPPGLEVLARLAQAGDVAAVTDQAHALKGSASNLGVTAMSTLLAEIEDDARAGTLPAPAALDRLRAVFAEVSPAMAELAATLGG
jgi:HPt (histidine-containing phosphotransfer) domain-containing protein